jgi:hypothetical protein
VTAAEKRSIETRFMKSMEKTFAKVVSRTSLRREVKHMKSRYVDPHVVCPFYSYEESSVTRKIHCEGYRKGVYMQLYFEKKDLKKIHKKRFCIDANNYQKCPLYQGNIMRYREDNDDD